ncbi:hypothetical protein J2S43_002094 [Catenuloplanes nepalensis]|uniref:DUF695 domain-containing protein n=1 Tax=Catenuloplanes nepalensis TaxID=587533 RepID=A0ABT9MQ84_9ACTN|nr:hypothetical protein [Catenuloplanes nepalensis]MDP9793582.1 hypothetical protein [Catenuloplanes nepalensis]
MPLPADMQNRLSDPEFWRAYHFETDDLDAGDLDDDDPDADDLDVDAVIADDDDLMTVEFPVGGGYALVLDIDVELREITLEMRSPNEPDRVQLGWDDESHWHPHVLRWDELDLIARAAAVHDPEVRHPGPVVALAGRFVVLGAGDDLDRITPLVDAAYGPPPPGAVYWPSARDWLHRADGRRDGVTWRQDGNGDWTVTQAEADGTDFALYSARQPGAGMLTAIRELLAAAEATLATGTPPVPATPVEEAWIEEVRTGAPRGSLIAARFGASPLRDSRRFLLDLHLPVDGRENAWVIALRKDLDRTLRDADRGWAEHSGATVAPGHGTLAEDFEIGVFDDLDAGVALIREVLRRHDAAPDTRLTRAGEPVG